MKKEISLKGKTAIVTGGATGIGFAIASELLDADANVIILGRREEKLKEAAEYSYAAEPPVQFRLSHLSRRSEPL